MTAELLVYCPFNNLAAVFIKMALVTPAKQNSVGWH